MRATRTSGLGRPEKPGAGGRKSHCANNRSLSLRHPFGGGLRAIGNISGRMLHRGEQEARRKLGMQFRRHWSPVPLRL